MGKAKKCAARRRVGGREMRKRNKQQTFMDSGGACSYILPMSRKAGTASGRGAEAAQAGELRGISREIWEMKYRLAGPDGKEERDIRATWRRVARAVAAAEAASRRRRWEEAFFSLMEGFCFLPGGRILAGAGSHRDVTLVNCFVMGDIDDSLSGIFDILKESALTMQAGGGIGLDFSPIRPRGAPVSGMDVPAAGPVRFMEVWDAMCRTISSAGARRGAMMGVLRCDHPDIEEFVTAKARKGRLTNFNLSVLVTDAFMEAVRTGRQWPLSFGGRTWRKVPARRLWETILRQTWDHAEPGVIFIDRINRENNLCRIEHIHATNPCGEQPLPPHGACLLGSLNLTRFVRNPFEADAALDASALSRAAALAVRFLDDALDVSSYPLEQQRREAMAKRRIGLGITGLADALAMCGLRYDSEEARKAAAGWMAAVERAAYLASTELAREKGPFPLFEAESYLASGHVRTLPGEVRAAIAERGIRNALVTSIAPTGTISLLAGNVSSGMEPIFATRYNRRLRQADGTEKTEVVTDMAVALFHRLKGEDVPLPDVFVTARHIHWRDHLAMQAALQRHVDAAISKTVNLPAEISFEEFRDVYETAYALGLKGCTTYRPNPVTGAVLSEEGEGSATDAAEAERTPQGAGQGQAAEVCPACGQPALTHAEGCVQCMACGHSHCGTRAGQERE